MGSSLAILPLIPRLDCTQRAFDLSVIKDLMATELGSDTALGFPQ